MTEVMASTITIYPKYSFINLTNTINGYQVYLSLTITIYGIDEDSKKIARIMDTLGNAGIFTISGFTYDT